MGIAWSTTKVRTTFYTNLTDDELERFIDTRFLYCRDESNRIWKATDVAVVSGGRMTIEMSVTDEELPAIL